MIIGLCGLAGSGKDTAAARLIDRHGYRRIAFADQMRTAAYALDPMVECGADHGHLRLSRLVDLVGWDRAKQIPDVRRLLQRLGTEVGREQWGTDFWVERATAGVTADDYVVFTDVRFANEAAAVHRLGGLVIEVVRPEVTRLAGPEGAHASEHIDFPVDRRVVNDGTLEQLHDAFEVAVGFGVVAA